MAEGGGTTLEDTPTWVVALVCTVIVVISLAVERILHFTGKYLMKKKQKPLFEALQKIKEELMLLGFISLLLTVFQGSIAKICISEHRAKQWLPCDYKHKYDDKSSSSSTSSTGTAHFQISTATFLLPGLPRPQFGFRHPYTEKNIHITCPPPADLAEILRQLRKIGAV